MSASRLLVAGLARAFVNRGLKVRPFKPQNMSNNAAVTADGGEIGRAQALQARAARVPPSVHMNPVLLKPQSEIGAQIVVQGRVYATARAAEYQRMKPDLMPFVLDSFSRLKDEADLVLVEGAGSASEVNLRRYDIANMGFARAADVPVILVGDIDRGGVIASLVGTKAVIDSADAAMIEGFIVNKFRGDPSLFRRRQKARSRKRPAGPRSVSCRSSPDARNLPAEDALALDRPATRRGGAKVADRRCLSCRRSPISTTSIRSKPSPRSNSCASSRAAALPGDADLVILPGSKATISDLAALRAAGFDIDIAAHVRRGGRVLGICGGYQMLGRTLSRSRRHRRRARHGARPRPARGDDAPARRRNGWRRRSARPPTASRSAVTRCIWA